MVAIIPKGIIFCNALSISMNTGDMIMIILLIIVGVFQITNIIRTAATI